MATIFCPECGKELKTNGTRWSCDACGKEYLIRFTCQVCGAEPEELAACGSVGYMCGSCNALRSRTDMNKEFIPADGD